MKEQHQFGGSWTHKKLERVRKYLAAYTTIFAKNPRAQKLIPIYVDPFAGTGYRTKPQQLDSQTTLFEELNEREAEEFLRGSAQIALETHPPFSRYIFIEKDPDRVKELEKLRIKYPRREIQIVQGDANNWLVRWCATTDWHKCRAVVFLDPYGMQVDWELIKALAKTQAIDTWILFPLGVAVNRLLTRSSEPPSAWANALTRILGTDDWREAFYSHTTEHTLFGTAEITIKEADFEKIGQFFIGRLKTVFAAVAENQLVLRNSRNTPLYLLYFAAGNPKGAKTAVKIAQDILRK
jgi:three-Cys-motif partner protein